MNELLLKRRSIRYFKDIPISETQISELSLTLLLSPTSRNLRPWSFIFVKDKSSIEALSKSKLHGSSFIKDAPLAVVMLGDTDKSDVWIEDLSIASVLLQLQAESMGLGSCWVQIRNRMHSDSETSSDYVKGLLQIPSNYEVLSIIPIGHPDEKRQPHDVNELDTECIYNEKFGNPMNVEM